MLIYIASPYSAETEAQRVANVERSMRAGAALIARGHWPLMPLMTHFFACFHEQDIGGKLSNEDYMQWDFAMLRHCDGLVYLAPSPGADRELALARALEIPVWMNVEDVPRA